MTVGDRIKNIRTFLHTNQTDFGIKLGVTQGSVAGWESNRRSPSDQTILSICREFSVNEHWLRTGDGDMFLPDPTDEFHIFVDQHQDATEIDKAVMRAYFDLNVQQREAFYEFCLRVADNSSPVEQETRWERDARLLQEEAEALKRDAEKCSALPPTKKA